jgi:HD-GYP domain-containing protein (c-di-GMP phosphodiesterase class II)
LTDVEYTRLKEHTAIGAELVEECHSLHALVPFVRHHHEHHDGTGYPDGLAGEEIPLEARILCLADAVEAMASDRSYKKARTAQEILEEIERCAGTQFDPIVANAFIRVVHKQGESVIVNSALDVQMRQAEPHFQVSQLGARDVNGHTPTTFSPEMGAIPVPS